jgi:RNA polymerase-interacting CarD/CdnL/TRCF family regulator
MKKTSSGQSKVLAVRLDAEVFNNLLVESTSRQITVSDIVRELINKHQQKGMQAEEDQDELRLLRGDVRTMRKELGLVAEIILLHALKIPKDQAREWVVKTFRLGW